MGNDPESTDEGGDESGEFAATDLRYVGAATAGVLDEAGIDPAAIAAKRVSHADLLVAGVNPGVAARIRREHSLSWSFEGGTDLDRRAAQVRGLGDDERDWVAASAGDWQTAAGDADAAPTTAGDGVGRREPGRPTPVTELDGVGEKRAGTLARAGINSVRSMALADPDEVAESLPLSPIRVARWREQARDRL